jgi:hypothetical protein
MFLECKRPLGSPRHRCEDTLKTDVIETVCEDVDWIESSDGLL